MLPDKGQEFVNEYEERLGSSVDTYTVYGYEVANVLLDAIQKAYEADGEVNRENVLQKLFAVASTVERDLHLNLPPVGLPRAFYSPSRRSR